MNNSDPSTNSSDSKTIEYHDGVTWIESDRRIAKRVAQPIREFMLIESASGIALLIATVAALVVANSPIGHDVHHFLLEEPMTIFSFRGFDLTGSVEYWINDGLMVLFFFVVGLEIKMELVQGELRDPRRAAVPALAAVGGMVLPAAIYLIINAGEVSSHGWGIPMATDIAFAVGVLSLLGNKVPTSLKVFLLTLAIVDDIGAIMVIAIFYTSSISFAWLGAAFALVAVVILMRVFKIWYIPLYVAIGILVWVAFLKSGVHATIAGVILGLITPTVPLRPTTTHVRVDADTPWDQLRTTIFEVRESLSVAYRLAHLISPWTAFVILPLFAFANAQIEIDSEMVEFALTAPVSYGVFFGLVLGKPLGVVLMTWISAKTKIGKLPDGVNWRQITGAGMLAGIGFTVALFVTNLAFSEELFKDEAKLAILVASVVASIGGTLLLRSGANDTSEQGAD